MNHSKRSHDILKVLNEVLLDDPVEVKKSKAPQLNMYDRTIDALSHLFGVGDPEIAVAERHGRGVGKKELESIMKDPSKHKEWMAQGDQPVQMRFGSAESLDDVKDKLKTAEYATIGAAAGLGGLAAAPYVAPYIAPVATKAASAVKAAAPYAGTAVRTTGEVLKSLPIEAKLALGGAGVGALSRLSPEVRDAIDYGQQGVEWLTTTPGKISAALDLTSGAVDIGQGQYPEGMRRLRSAAINYFGGKLPKFPLKTTVLTATDIANNLDLIPYVSDIPLPPSASVEKPLIGIDLDKPWDKVFSIAPEGFGDEKKKSIPPPQKDSGRKFQPSRQQKQPEAPIYRPKVKDDESSGQLSGSSIASGIYEPQISTKTHKFTRLGESKMSNNTYRQLMIETTLNKCMSESIQLNEFNRAARDLLRQVGERIGRSTRNVDDLGAYHPRDDWFSVTRTRKPTREPLNLRGRAAGAAGGLAGSVATTMGVHSLMRLLAGQQGAGSAESGGGSMNTFGHSLYNLTPEQISRGLPSAPPMVRPMLTRS